MVITPTEVRDVGWAELAGLLLAPMREETAVLAPLKGILPVVHRVQYGSVVSDEACFGWSPQHRAALTAMTRARAELGASNWDFDADFPGCLGNIAPSAHQAVLRTWQQFKQLRDDVPVWMFLKKLTYEAVPQRSVAERLAV